MNYKESEKFDSSIGKNLATINENDNVVNTEDLDPNYILELISLFQDPNNEHFKYAKDVLIRIIKTNPYNLIQFLNENGFFDIINEIFHSIQDQSIFDSCIEIFVEIFEATNSNPQIMNFIPITVIQTLIDLLQPENNIINISKILNAFLILLENDREYANQLYDLDFFGLCLSIDESLVDEANFQGNESIEMEVISETMRISMLFFITLDREKFTNENILTLLERFKIWVLKDDDKCDPFYQALKGFAIIASYDVNVMENYLKDSLFMEEIYKVLRFSNETLVNCSLKFLYYCAAEYNDLIDLETLIQNIQPHLVRRGSSVSTDLMTTACDVMAIFLGFQETHELLIDSGIVGMIAVLLDDQLMEVKTASARAMSNLLTSCEPQVIQYIVTEYSIISPMVSLLESDEPDIIICVIHSLIKIIEANEVLGNSLQLTIQKIVDEVDLEKLQELSDVTTSVTSDLAQKLLDIISPE